MTETEKHAKEIEEGAANWVPCALRWELVLTMPCRKLEWLERRWRAVYHAAVWCRVMLIPVFLACLKGMIDLLQSLGWDGLGAGYAAFGISLAMLWGFRVPPLSAASQIAGELRAAAQSVRGSLG